jgi:hypothetical protein
MAAMAGNMLMKDRRVRLWLPVIAYIQGAPRCARQSARTPTPRQTRVTFSRREEFHGLG